MHTPTSNCLNPVQYCKPIFLAVFYSIFCIPLLYLLRLHLLHPFHLLPDLLLLDLLRLLEKTQLFAEEASKAGECSS